MDRGFDGSLRFEFRNLGHEKLELSFRLVLVPSKLFYTPDQSLCPVWHLLKVSGGVGSRPEVSSRSGGHALIPNDVWR